MTLMRAIFCLLILAVADARAADPLPAADFARGERFANPKLSPDGRHIAITARETGTKGDVYRLLIYRIADKQPASVLNMPHHRMPAGYVWASDTRLVIEQGALSGSIDKPELTGVVLATDLDGKNQAYLYGPEPGDSLFARAKGADRGWGFVEGVPQPPNGRVWLRVRPWDNPRRSQLYDLDTSNGSKRLLADIDVPGLDFTLRNDGRVAYASGVDADNRWAVFRRADDGDWQRLAADATGEQLDPIAFTPDDTAFFAYYSATGGPLALVRQNAQSGERTVLASDPRANVYVSQWAGAPRQPFAATTFDGEPRTTYLDAERNEAQVHRAIAAKFPGLYVALLSISRDGNVVLFSIAGDRDPGSYYVFDVKARSIAKLFAAQPWIDPARMAPRRPVRLAASDGVELSGFLTLPPGADKNLPLVLLPHGGPHGIADDWFFDRDAQFLANRGYAVLQVNFRGSGGRGPAFQRAGYREWGGRIQQDLIDGARWAIASGHADARRVGIYGASFGGYSAVMASIRAPDLFRCAVGYAGVYDLALLPDSPRAQHSKALRRFLDDVIGTDEAVLAANSPSRLVDKLAAPVLIVHGEDDEIAPFDHARALRTALQKHDKPFEWMAVPEEGHGFYSEANRTRFYEKLGEFLDRHLKAPD